MEIIEFKDYAELSEYLLDLIDEEDKIVGVVLNKEGVINLLKWLLEYENIKLGHIDIKDENVHVPSGLGDVEANCKSYDEAALAAHVDIQLLGIGSDGHIGFSEPGTPFDEGTHIATLAESTRVDNYRFFKDLNEEVPTHAITMGPKTIMAAKKILMVANGKNKAAAIKGMLEGPITTDCPASILQKHPDVTVIIDEDAASELTKY